MATTSNLPPDEVFDDAEGRRSRYNLDTRILVTAIFCLVFVVALVTFLHLYTRYVLRRQREAHRATTISLFRVGVAAAGLRDEPPKAGLDPSVITALPTFPYRRTNNNASNGRNDGSSADCAICLSVIEEGEMVRLLPSCTHVFHVGCIDMWLGSNSTCPVCRAGVEPPPMAVAVERGESSAPPPPRVLELSGGGVGEGTSEPKEGGLKDGGSMSSRFSSSFRRMYMSSRERSAGRRTQGDEIEDLERQ